MHRGSSRLLAILAVDYAALYLGWRTFNLVFQLETMYRANPWGLWLCPAAIVTTAIVGTYALAACGGRIFRALPNNPLRAATGLGIVTLIAVIEQQLSRFAFWIFSRNPWVVPPGRFLDLQVEATSTIALVLSIAIVAVGLDITLQLARLVLWLDLPHRWRYYYR